ncbi:hypothetical protein GCM10027174_00560 [Salinifilum aidingensis]
MSDPEAAQEPGTTDVAELKRRSGSVQQLFDVRMVVGGLFLVYGVLIGGAGVFAGPADLAKAQGININLWTGASMLVVGALFLLWLGRRPLRPPEQDSTAEEPAEADEQRPGRCGGGAAPP